MSILEKATVDQLATAVVKVAQLSAQGADLEALYTGWDQLKADEDIGTILEMEERYRMTKMPLPHELGTVIPTMFNYEDYTEKEIIKIHQRKKYMPMDELQGYKQYSTREMQGAIKDVFSNNLSGMMLSAAAGWGKSTIYEYFGAMAAQHSLTHKELWMKPGAQKNLAGMKDPGNIREQHFLKFDASNLGQTEGLKGRTEQVYRELEKIIKDPKYSGIYTFVVDELYSALASDSSDASEAWNLMKGYLAPTPHIKVIGTFATEDLKKFKDGKNPRTGEAFYNPQMQRRMPLIAMRDYTREEGMQVLENGYDSLVEKAGLPPQLPDPNHEQLFATILDKADLATNASGHIVFGLPARIEKVLRTAANEVRSRSQKFEAYKVVQDKLERAMTTIAWDQKAVPRLEQEKQAIQNGRGFGEEEAVAPTPNRAKTSPAESNIISIRDMGGKLPHEAIEEPEVIEQQKKEILSQKDELIAKKKDEISKLKKAVRIWQLDIQQGIAKLKQKYGDVFQPDFSDIGNIKQQDVAAIPQSAIIMASAS